MEKEKFDPQSFLTKIKGKDYLEIKYRLHWFRLEKPLWDIRTEVIKLDIEKGFAAVKADIYDEQGNHKSPGIKSEYQKNFFDYLEKAETGAIGRALSLAGYGTVQCFDMDEGINEGRICDAPVTSKANPPTKPTNYPSKALEENKRSGERIISEAQRKRMFALSGGNKELIDETITKYGFTSSKEVTMGNCYDSICMELENLKRRGEKPIEISFSKYIPVACDEFGEPPPGF